jgi:dTDP-4-amino-4,6-dideoxygalactose transaminase
VQAVYDRELPFGGDLERYRFPADAVPWRYNARVPDPALRSRIVRELLEAGVRVSVWYPPVHRVFGDAGDYPNASRFSREIVNLPLDVTAQRASEICAVIRRTAETRVSG